jgi:hypothetical protein
MAAVCKTKLRVRMYTGFGSPVEPDVKFTNPGVARNGNGRVALDAGRGSETTQGRSPIDSAAADAARIDGGRNTGVPGGIGGELRQALGSGGRTTTGKEWLLSVKKRAIASG